MAKPYKQRGHGVDPLLEGFLGPSQWEPGLAYVPDFGPGPAEAAATRPNGAGRNRHPAESERRHCDRAGMLVQVMVSNGPNKAT